MNIHLPEYLCIYTGKDRELQYNPKVFLIFLLALAVLDKENI